MSIGAIDALLGVEHLKKARQDTMEVIETTDEASNGARAVLNAKDVDQ